MDATTTPSITSLVAKLQLDYPSYRFKDGEEFRWSPQEKIIFYDAGVDDTASLLHELSHALLGHATYQRDVELIAIERAAWEYAARVLSEKYEVTITVDTIEDALDTYRDWLHARSVCPSCKATGMQVKDHTYRCIACFTQWRVNDAKSYALRRWKELPAHKKERL
jgi:hypothetical protein